MDEDTRPRKVLPLWCKGCAAAAARYWRSRVWLAVRYFFGNRAWLNPDDANDLVRMRTAWEKLSSSSIVFAGQCKWEKLVTVARRSSRVGRLVFMPECCWNMLACGKDGREQHIKREWVTRKLSQKWRAGSTTSGSRCVPRTQLTGIAGKLRHRHRPAERVARWTHRALPSACAQAAAFSKQPVQ